MASAQNDTLDGPSEAVERLHGQLRESLHALITSDDWQQALAVAARFHDYSFANSRLIWSQAVSRGFHPSRVAGYRTWQSLGHQVRRGESGLAILAPVIRKIDVTDGEEERRVVGFRVVHVFDLSQTEGEPLPEVQITLVEGDMPGQWGKITELIDEAGFSLQVADIERLGEANGITDWRKREVVVRANLPGAQRFKTAVHELAHIRLHEPNSQGRPNCRGIVEVEAESVAYVICAALGVDTTGYSLPYVASWSGGDLDKVTATADRVIRCAHQVITHLEADRHLEHDRSRASTSGRQASKELSPSIPDTPEAGRVGAGKAEEALRTAVAFYQDQLRHDNHAQAFLKERGVTKESENRWQLGYAPPSWDSLVKTLRGEGISDEILLETGLAGQARTGRLYDRMRGRVIFPICDAEGSPRGFAGRLIAGDGPKYLNSPETSFYKKSKLLYGLDLAQPAVAENKRVVIVEGYTDAIAAHQVGITDTVATGGTALTTNQIDTIRLIASTITLAFDGDQAGLQAAERVADLSRTGLGGVQLQIAHLPDGADPAGLIAEGRADLLHAALGNPTPLLHHLIDRILDQYDLNEVEATARALYAVSPLIDRLTNPADRPTAVRHLAGRLDRGEEIIEQSLREYAPLHRRQREQERSYGRALA